MRKDIRAILQKVSRYQQSVVLVNVYKTPGETLIHSVYLYIYLYLYLGESGHHIRADVASSFPIQKVVGMSRGRDQRSRVNMLARLEDGKEDLKKQFTFPLLIYTQGLQKDGLNCHGN